MSDALRGTGREGLETADAFRDTLRARHARMGALVTLLASPPAGVDVQCLAIDTLYEARGQDYRQNSLLVHNLEPASPEFAAKLRAIGSTALTAGQWRLVRAQAHAIAAAPEVRGPRASDTEDAVIVCFFDGGEWTRRAWVSVRARVHETEKEPGLRAFTMLMDHLARIAPRGTIADTFYGDFSVEDLEAAEGAAR